MGSLASGRGGIAPQKIALIEQLIGEGLSDRQIARRADVHRAKVAKLRRGEPVGETNDHSGVFERCGGCGGRVTMPCRACHVRALIAEAEQSTMLPTMHTVFARQRQQAAAGRGSPDRRDVCGHCNKPTTDLYFVDPATNTMTVEGRCPDCQELATARATRTAVLIPATGEPTNKE